MKIKEAIHESDIAWKKICDIINDMEVSTFVFFCTMAIVIFFVIIYKSQDDQIY